MLEPFVSGSDMIRFSSSVYAKQNLRPFKIWLPTLVFVLKLRISGWSSESLFGPR